MTRILVGGAGGFIGGHLVGALLRDGYEVRGVDIKPLAEWWQVHRGAESLQGDLSLREVCAASCDGIEQVYNLACDMGGMGFIENNKALCMLSVLINTHLLMAAHAAGVKRYFYSSSACVYRADKQTSFDVTALKEEDAYPASPEDGYGWEKLFSERMCRHFTEDFGLETRVARFHNIFGSRGSWEGGREKAPAAICRKVAEAKLTGKHDIVIWGDGRQVRSYTYIDDCLEGVQRLMSSDVREPINIGSSEMVSVNQLVDYIEEIGGVKLTRRYDLHAPKGVNGRNSDNTRIKELFGWEPGTGLREGLKTTYASIYDQVAEKLSKGG